MLKTKEVYTNTNRILKLEDTITMLQDSVNEKNSIIESLKQRIKELETKNNNH